MGVWVVRGGPRASLRGVSFCGWAGGDEGGVIDEVNEANNGLGGILISL
jgi:hypothetical protein